MTTASPRLAVQLVAALDRNRCIGKQGALPWHFPEDLRHFRQLTTGHCVIMGRKTFDSIGRPLPKRRNIVVTRNRASLSERATGIEVATSLDEALRFASASDSEPFVIGGEQLYRLALPLATHLHLTFVDEAVEGGDTFFPEFDERDFVEADRAAAATPGLTFVTFVRAPHP